MLRNVSTYNMKVYVEPTVDLLMRSGINIDDIRAKRFDFDAAC